MGIEDRDFRVKLRGGVVQKVHADASTRYFDIVFQDTSEPCERVRLASGGANQRDGGFAGAIPTEGDYVLCGQPRADSEYFILGSAHMPTLEGDPLSEEDTAWTESRPRDNHTGGTPTLYEGDKGFTHGQGRILLRPGGLVEIQASPTCLQHFFEDTGTIRQVFSNLVQEGFWGERRFFTHREYGRDLDRKTPVGMQLSLKSIATEMPHIFLDAGTILEEEKLLLPGKVPLAGRGPCLRFMVFDQPTAKNEYKHGFAPPNPQAAQLLVRMDTAGNLFLRQKGQTTWTMSTLAVYVEGRATLDTGGWRLLARSTDISLTAARGRVRITGKSGIDLASDGDVTIKAKRLQLQLDGWEQIMNGNWRVAARSGVASLESGQGMNLSTGGDLSVSSQNRGDYVGGRFSMRVGGGGVAENVGRDVITHKTVVSSGKMAVRVEQGSLELSLGTKGAPPLCSIRMHRDMVKGAQWLGSIEITTLTGARLILSPQGGWSIGGPLAEIKGEPTGRIQIGDAASPSYNVVTSQTLDQITGLPLLGNPMVTVASKSPPSPLPISPPNIGPEPAHPRIPFPDEPEFI